MGQIVARNAKAKRCNVQALQGSLKDVVLAAGEYMLVSTDNSMTEEGQGNFDGYVVGDGSTKASGLEVKWCVDDIRMLSDTAVNLAGLTRLNFLLLDTNKWGTGVYYKHVIYPVKAGEQYKITAKSDASCSYAFLTSDTLSGGSAAPLVAGHSRVVVSAGSTTIVTIPATCEYMYFYTGNSNTSTGWEKLPESLVLIGRLTDRVRETENGLLLGKNICVAGSDNTWSKSAYYRGFVGGHTYRVFIKDKNIDMSSVTSSSSYFRLGFILRKESDGSESYAGQPNVYMGTALKDYYDLIIPSDDIYSLQIGMRASKGAEQVFVIEDVTEFEGIEAEIKTGLEKLSAKTLEKVLRPKSLNNCMWCNSVEVGQTVTSYVSTSSSPAYATLSYIPCKKDEIFQLEYMITNGNYRVGVYIADEPPTVAGVEMELLFKDTKVTGTLNKHYFTAPKDGYIVVQRKTDCADPCNLYQFTNIRQEAEKYEFKSVTYAASTSNFNKGKILIINPNSSDYGNMIDGSSVNYGVSRKIDVSTCKFLELPAVGVGIRYCQNNGCAFYDEQDAVVDVVSSWDYTMAESYITGSRTFIVKVPDGAVTFRFPAYVGTSSAAYDRTIGFYGPKTISEKEEEDREQIETNTEKIYQTERDIESLQSSILRFDGQHLPYVGTDGWIGPRTLQEYIARKKADMFVGCKWTPKGNIPWSTRSTSAVNYYEKGVQYQGIPYSSNQDHGKWLGTHVSLYTFMTAVNNKYSLLYTECLKTGNTKSAWGYAYMLSGNGSTYYGTVCCGFTSYVTNSNVVWNNPNFYSLPNMFTMIQQHNQTGNAFNMNLLKIGDILDDGAHSYMIYDIKHQDGIVIDFAGREATSGVDTAKHIARGSQVRTINKTTDLARFDHFRYNYFYTNTELRKGMDENVWVNDEISVSYNDDICTIAGDKATFSEDSVIALNYNLDDRASFPYDTIVVKNAGTGAETSYLIAEIDDSTYDSSQQGHALKLEGLVGGKYEAWCKNSSTNAESAKTYFIVVSADDITFQITDDGIVATLNNKSYRIGLFGGAGFTSNDFGNEPKAWQYSNSSNNAIVQPHSAILRPNDAASYDKNAEMAVTIDVMTEYGIQKLRLTLNGQGD